MNTLKKRVVKNATKRAALRASNKAVKKVAKKVKPAVKKKAVKPKDVFAKAKMYVGLKEIDAVPMTRGGYNKFKGWNMPADENSKDTGYLVRYPDGYISWSPTKQFEEAYSATGKLSFSAAVYLMKKGYKLARTGWNGKGMWCMYVPGTKKAELRPGTPYANALPRRKTIEILPHFDMYTVNAQGRRAMLPGWLASQSDIDADDWCIVK